MYPDISLWPATLLMIGGFWLMTWSADQFISCALALAQRFSVAPFLVGIVIIGFGTSLPELMVSSFASAETHPALALGNAYGSNIFNIAVILGLMAILRPIPLKPRIRRIAVPLLASASVISWLILAQENCLTRTGAITLLILFVLSTAALIKSHVLEQPTHTTAASTPRRHIGLGLTTSLGLIFLASHLIIWGAVGAARTFGVSELTIGLSIVAAGTSLPELATAWASIKKHQDDLVIGNIIGSNLFNALAVVGISGLIRPITDVPQAILWRDLPLMTALTFTLFSRRISRILALVWLLIFAAYLFFVSSAEAHENRSTDFENERSASSYSATSIRMRPKGSKTMSWSLFATLGVGNFAPCA